MANSKYRNDAVWKIKPRPDNDAPERISESLGVTRAMGRLLYGRGCADESEAASFIRRERDGFYDPYLLPDMRAAVGTIVSAVERKEKIVIYGDYDADGVTSVSVLYLFLKGVGADVSYYIPKRSEGYGMSCGAIRKIADDGVKLIITVDTGITAIEEIKLAGELGVDVVVTDHHECMDEIPTAAAVVNPQRRDSEYPFPYLAGVGVVYKLCCALDAEYNGDGGIAGASLRISERFGDLVAIGTVADVMPVLDENRLIVSYGLRRIDNSTRPGLRALMEASASGQDGTKKAKRPRVTSGYISFTLAPRINAAGRIADATLAVEMFLSTDEAKAKALAERLCEVNRERQMLENVIAESAYEKIESSHDFEHDPVIVVADEGWHNGIIGIVASRVTEKYGRPSILISFEHGGGEHDIGKGSGRSVKGLNLAKALGECGEYLVKFGGHELAAGLSVERCRLDDFKRAINDVARRELDGADVETVLIADDELSPDEMTLRLADELRLLEPYGVGNPTPLFYTQNIKINDASGVGANKHTRLTLDAGGGISAMCFSVSPEQLDVYKGECVDIMYNLDVNEFRGERSAQLIVRAVRKSEKQTARESDELLLYMSLLSGEAERRPEYALMIPQREDFSALYRVLRHELSMKRSRHTARGISSLMTDVRPMSYIKVKLALDIFSEMKILDVRHLGDDGDEYDIFPIRNEGKVQLERSHILSSLLKRYG